MRPINGSMAAWSPHPWEPDGDPKMTSRTFTIVSAFEVTIEVPCPPEPDEDPEMAPISDDEAAVASLSPSEPDENPEMAPISDNEAVVASPSPSEPDEDPEMARIITIVCADEVTIEVPFEILSECSWVPSAM